MITGDPNRIEAVTYATADDIQDVIRHIDNNINGTTDHEQQSFEHKTSRIADDLNEEYQGWFGDNRYKITIIVEKI